MCIIYGILSYTSSCNHCYHQDTEVFHHHRRLPCAPTLVAQLLLSPTSFSSPPPASLLSFFFSLSISPLRSKMLHVLIIFRRYQSLLLTHLLKKRLWLILAFHYHKLAAFYTSVKICMWAQVISLRQRREHVNAVSKTNS